MGATLRILAALAIALPAAAAERVVELPTRPGATLRMLVDAPASPIGSIVLLPGGLGAMDIAADGRIGDLYGNPPIRTRARYVAAGFAVGALDLASDVRVEDGAAAAWMLRVSREHVADLGAAVAHMRTIAAPVAVLGFSRGSVSAAAAAPGAGAARPDAIVLMSGVWATPRRWPNSVEWLIDRDGAWIQPTLLVAHADDSCPVTQPSDIARVQRALRASTMVASRSLSGGGPPRGDRCGPFHHHGFVGQDDEAVALVVAWLRTLSR